MGRYDLDEYEEYEDEGEEQEEDIGEDEEEEEDHPPSQEEMEFLHLRQKLKESIRKKKKDLSSGLANSREKKNKMPYDNFGSFFGPSQPVIAQRVIQESKSLLENPHLAAKFSKAKNVQNRGGASTPVVSKTQSCEQPREVINLAKPKAKIQMLRDTRDYSFLLSEDADLPAPTKNPPKSMPAPANNPPKRMPAPTNNPSKSMPAPTRNPPKSMPAPKPEVHPSQRKTSNTARKVINGGEERKSSPKVSQMRAKAGLSIQKPSTAAKLTSTSLESRKQLSRNDGSGPARPSAPKSLPLKEPVARKENVFSASVAKGSVPSVHKSLHSKQPPSVHKKPVAQKRDYTESCKGNVIAKKPLLSSKPQIKQQPAKVPPSAQQKERLKKRPLRSYSDDDDGAISMIRSMFGYNPSRYRGVDEDDDSDMEAGFDDIMMEENHSARIAAKEDEEELRKIKEEEERERMRKAAKKRKLNQQ